MQIRRDRLWTRNDFQRLLGDISNLLLYNELHYFFFLFWIFETKSLYVSVAGLFRLGCPQTHRDLPASMGPEGWD